MSKQQEYQDRAIADLRTRAARVNAQRMKDWISLDSQATDLKQRIKAAQATNDDRQVALARQALRIVCDRMKKHIEGGGDPGESPFDRPGRPTKPQDR